jgi:hypothetical protein
VFSGRETKKRVGSLETDRELALLWANWKVDSRIYLNYEEIRDG